MPDAIDSITDGLECSNCGKHKCKYCGSPVGHGIVDCGKC